MLTGIKIVVLSYVSNPGTGEIFFCGCHPSTIDVTVLLIMSIWSSADLLGCKTPPLFFAQTNLTDTRNFTFRTIFENVRWHCSLVWILQVFPRYPLAELNVYFISFSNTPQFQQLSQNNMHPWICLELLTHWEHCKITDWKMITLSEFYFQARAPSSSTERVTKNLLPNFHMVSCSNGLAYRRFFAT